MRYASFTAADGTPTWGVIADGTAYDLGPTGLRLAAGLQDAVAHGVFGSPSFLVGDELFFGKDRLRDVEEELAAQSAR